MKGEVRIIPVHNYRDQDIFSTKPLVCLFLPDGVEFNLRNKPQVVISKSAVFGPFTSFFRPGGHCVVNTNTAPYLLNV